MRRLALLIVPFLVGADAHAADVTISARTPMTPPAWALLERELLRANTAACREFFDRYFDERGYLHVRRALGRRRRPRRRHRELHRLARPARAGRSDEVLHMYKKAWEGHLRQYTAAKTTQVPFARDGMYYKEFPVMFDWLHNGEGLTRLQPAGPVRPVRRQVPPARAPLCRLLPERRPGRPELRSASTRSSAACSTAAAGRSLRKATALDWAGDPIEVENRFASATANATISRCSITSRTTTTSSAIIRSTC